MVSAFVPVGIALGSNLGDRAGEIEAGFAFLRTLAADGRVRRSTVIETEPLDCPPGSPAFLNAVAEIQVEAQSVNPHQLHARLRQFERERGRPARHPRNAPRPLDLDLLYFGGAVIDTPNLTVPHPRIAGRRFVLAPLAELRPGLVLPGQTRTVRGLLEGGAQALSVLDLGSMEYREHLHEIEKLAYHLWEKEGRPEGRAMANWLKAERMLSDDAFLEHELDVEEDEGGLVARETKPQP